MMKNPPQNLLLAALAFAEAADEREDRKAEKKIAASEAREGVLQTYRQANAPRLRYAEAKKRFRSLLCAFRRARAEARRGFTPTLEDETRDWLMKRGFEI